MTTDNEHDTATPAPDAPDAPVLTSVYDPTELSGFGPSSVYGGAPVAPLESVYQPSKAS